jgi:hypothetical protein
MHSDVILLLWSDRFDEAAAVIFATELRQVGLSVKLVGLAGQQAVGSYGLVLGSDLTLSNALRIAHRAVGVILPCTPAAVERINNDPRVHELLQRACHNQVWLVMQQADGLADSWLNELPLAKDHVLSYGDSENLILFARTLAYSLANVAYR